MPSDAKNPAADEITARLAMMHVQTQVLSALAWLVRPQDVSDYGIDAHIETVEASGPTGRLIAAQVKGGPSAFKTPTEGGWYFSVEARHAAYWLNHSLPVVLILVDNDAERCYWQAVNSRTLISTGKHFKVLVPADHDLRDAKEDWNSFTAEYSATAEGSYSTHLSYLSPAVRTHLDVLRDSSYYAAGVLVSDLAAGRHDPSSTVQELMRARGEWLDRHGRTAWMTVLTFAIEHEDHAAATTALVHLADVDRGSRASYLANAAIQALREAPERARALGEEARDLDADNPSVLVADAYLGYDTDAAERKLASATDALTANYFAGKALSRADYTEALRRLEQILEDQPHSVQARLLMGQAYLRRSTTRHSQPSDRAAAERHLRESLQLHRVWSINTAGTLEALLVALASQTKFAELIREASTPPLGTATQQESTHSAIRYLAAQAALRIGRPDLAADPVPSMGDAVDSLPVERWEGLLDHALETHDHARTFEAVLQLALQGVDAVSRLDPIAAISDAQRTLLRTVAHASDPASDSLPALKRLARTELLAAETVVDVHRKRGDKSAALDATDQYFGLYGVPSFIMTNAQIHLDDGDPKTAAAVLADALSRNQLTGDDKRSAHLVVGQSHARTNEWGPAKEHLQAALDENPFTTEEPFWALCQVYVADGDLNPARRLFDDHPHLPEGDSEIELWAHVHSQTGWDDMSATRAVEFAEDQERAPEIAMKLAGNIVSFTRTPHKPNPETGVAEEDTTDLRPLVAGELHSRAFRVIAALQDRHGGVFDIRVAGTTGEELREQLTEILKNQRDPERDQFAQRILRGELPLGLLSELRSDPYALQLASRADGARIACHSNSDQHAQETVEAQASRGGNVIIDLSAIELALELGVWDDLYGEYNVITLPTQMKRDALAAASRARSDTASKGGVYLDRNGKIWRTETDPARSQRILERCEHIVDAVSTLRTAAPTPAKSLPDELHELADDTWISALTLALASNLPLWADDLGLRLLATASGVRTFGTVNLLEARIGERIAAATTETDLERAAREQHALVTTLIDHRVADQPATVEDIIANIRRHPGELAPAAEVLRRGAWWAEAGTIEPWEQIISAVREHAPTMVREWQAFAVVGLCEAMPGAAAVPVVTTLVAMGTEPETSLVDIVEGVRLADSICESREVPLRPSRVLPLVVRRLKLHLAGGSTEDLVVSLIGQLEIAGDVAIRPSHGEPGEQSE